MADYKNRPVPAKYYASWEIEKSSPYSIPRHCSLKLTHLAVKKALEADLTSLVIAIKMELGSQGSKRTLRSSEITVGSDGLLDIDLDITYSLQYLHFLKKDGNKLQIMLQRRKRYRNRTILGYKTLAIGQISMARVLQRTLDKEDMLLFNDLKDVKREVASLSIVGLSSEPVNPVDNGRRKILTTTEADRSPDLESDEDEPVYESSNEDMMSETEVLDNHRRHRTPSSRRRSSTTSRHGNFKQKFIALLKRFRASEDEVLNSDQDMEPTDLLDPNPGDIDDLLDELDDSSDSTPEIDKISVISTPKPSLRPYFTGSQHSSQSPDIINDKEPTWRSEEHIKDIDSQVDVVVVDTDNDVIVPENDLDPKPVLDPRSPKSLTRDKSTSFKEIKQKERHRVERRASAGNAADNVERSGLLDELALVLRSEDSWLPESFVLVNTADVHGQLISHCLQECHMRVICTCNIADIKATVTYLVNKIQKFCNTNSQNPAAVKCAIAGSDAFITSFLRPWIELFSAKPLEWQNYIQFIIIPVGTCTIAKYLCSIDRNYESSFSDAMWHGNLDNNDRGEIFSKISHYIKSAGTIYHMPVSEALITCRASPADEESTQSFIPFIMEVAIGTDPSLPIESDDKELQCANLSTSPPNMDIAPPTTGMTLSPSTLSASNVANEVIDLVIDYWTVTSQKAQDGESKKKEGNKYSLKASIKALSITRVQGDSGPGAMTMVIHTKEKKKIIRIGKKSKEFETKTQTIEGINRLICTSKNQNNPFTVTIDGIEWKGVKFFQLLSQWQTHVKSFPVLLSEDNH